MGTGSQALRTAFHRQQVLSLPEMVSALRCSGRTAIRRLQSLDYRSSYSHRGSYYTLVEVARFDGLGLWHHEDIHFSRWGTLKRTVEALVARSEAGYRHRELEEQLQVRCHNVLLQLTKAGRVHRRKPRTPGPSVYFAVDSSTQGRQEAERRRLLGVEEPLAESHDRGVLSPTDATATIAVLVALVKDPEASPAILAHRVQKQGLDVSPAQVRQLFDAYQLSEKGAL